MGSLIFFSIKIVHIVLINTVLVLLVVVVTPNASAALLSSIFVGSFRNTLLYARIDRPAGILGTMYMAPLYW